MQNIAGEVRKISFYGLLHMDTPVLTEQQIFIFIYIYIYQLCTNTGCSQEDLQGAMNDWDSW